jgi:hypothetical protein
MNKVREKLGKVEIKCVLCGLEIKYSRKHGVWYSQLAGGDICGGNAHNGMHRPEWTDVNPEEMD